MDSKDIQPAPPPGQADLEKTRNDSVDSSKGFERQAKLATEREHSLSTREAIRQHPKAILFSLIFSMAIIMEGYDLSIAEAFYGYPAFRNKFGNEPAPDGGRVISADMQSYILNGGMAGQIIGLYINGYVSDWFGYKKTMLGAQVIMIAFCFLPFFAQNIETILAGHILLGIPWGIFQTLSLSYASDIAPVVLRPYLTTYINMCWVIGQFIGSGVLFGCEPLEGDWSYRIPYALQWIWPPIIIVGTLFAPESPWWLVRHGRLEEARASLMSLTKKDNPHFDADDHVALIQHTNEMEARVKSGTQYWHCFSGIDLRRTEIASVCFLTQQWCGTSLQGYAVQFFERGGLHVTDALAMNMGRTALGFIGTIISWVLMNKFGRRHIFIAGLGTSLVILTIIGGLGFGSHITAVPWVIGTFIMVFTALYQMMVGPVCYSIVAEIPSTRLKIKTVVLARAFYNIAGFLNNSLMPRMIGVNSWNWGAKTGLFWAGFCLVIFIWAFFRLPEPKGRTYGELDILFHNKVPARKFSKTKVDQFSANQASFEHRE